MDCEQNNVNSSPKTWRPANCNGSTQELHARMMPNQIRLERRTDRRFPLTAELSYRITSVPDQPRIGRGMTVNISRRAVLISTAEPIPAGTPIELSIAW